MLLDSNDPSMDPELQRFYDPRIVQIEDRLLLCLAADTRHGVCGVIAALSDDLQTCRVLSTTAPDNRNLVLFPEKIGGEYVRLERPMPVYSRGKDRFDIWISRSPDLIYWGQSRLLLGVEDVPWANNKIGPTASLWDFAGMASSAARAASADSLKLPSSMSLRILAIVSFSAGVCAVSACDLSSCADTAGRAMNAGRTAAAVRRKRMFRFMGKSFL